eukprot:3649167-Prymnesium_polylepis.1
MARASAARDASSALKSARAAASSSPYTARSDASASGSSVTSSTLGGRATSAVRWPAGPAIVWAFEWRIMIWPSRSCTTS